MVKLLTFYIGLIFLVLFSCHSGKNIQIIRMTTHSLWKEFSMKMPLSDATDPVDIRIDLARKQQVIEGFGACFNELGWDALLILDSADREDLLFRIFDQEKGCKFNICRMPIGANDYALDWYSFDETPGDYEMAHFNIGRDHHFLIPYIQAARKYAPDLKIWASPWCPPTWMKTNKYYACKMDKVNDLCCEELEGQEGVTQFIMEDEVLAAYALYFTRFLQAYANLGIDIFAVHPQNEPNSCQNFPSCIWTASDLATFIGKYLGPGLEENGLKTQIWYGTIERPFIENIDTVLTDSDAKKYVAGVGFQWAGKEAIEKTHEKYPDMKLMQTESECGDGSNDWAAAMHTFDLIQHYLNSGANSYMYWNMVLDETGKSHWGWKQNSLVTINRVSKTITFNPEFYLMKLFSSLIRPGAVKLKADPVENILAFQNPGGEGVMILRNPDDNQKNKKIRFADKTYQVILEPQSVTAFILNDIEDPNN
jgi:glucosylceramidase